MCIAQSYVHQYSYQLPLCMTYTAMSVGRWCVSPPRWQRACAKSVTWQFVSLSFGILVAYALLDDWDEALEIFVLNTIGELVLMVLHEHVWQSINFPRGYLAVTNAWLHDSYEDVEFSDDDSVALGAVPTSRSRASSVVDGSSSPPRVTWLAAEAKVAHPRDLARRVARVSRYTQTEMYDCSLPGPSQAKEALPPRQVGSACVQDERWTTLGPPPRDVANQDPSVAGAPPPAPAGPSRISSASPSPSIAASS